MNNNRQILVVNEEGEVIEDLGYVRENENVVKLSSGDRIYRATSIDYLRKTTRVKTPFVKLHIDGIKDLVKIYPNVMLLFPLISYLDNILRFGNNQVVNSTNFYKAINTSPDNAKKLIKRLTDAEIVHKHGIGKRSYFVFNPYICSCGKAINKDVVDEFEESYWNKGGDDIVYRAP